MRTLAFLIGVLGMLVLESLRSPKKEEDDDIGLFVGSARPLAVASRPRGRRGPNR
jgi:hypothetical protein